MSFSHEVKDELLEVRLRRNEDGRMLVSGYTLAIAALKYSRAHRTWGLHYVSEYSPGIGFAAKLACRNYELEHEISLNVHERLNARNTELFLYGPGVERLEIESGLISVDKNGERSYETHLPKGLDAEHSLRAFVRGLFLACGTVADPEKGCQAELVFKNEAAAHETAKLLCERGIPPKIAKRRSLFVLYFKNGDSVEDFLTFMGAGEAMLRVREHRMLRELKNMSNREVNCFSANMEKAARASASSVEDITLIMSQVGPDALSEELYAVAEARMAEPELTLSQLAEKLGLGRSAVNYRLRKIAAIASEIREREVQGARPAKTE